MLEAQINNVPVVIEERREKKKKKKKKGLSLIYKTIRFHPFHQQGGPGRAGLAHTKENERTTKRDDG